MDILGIKENQSFEILPAFSNSWFWFTVNPLNAKIVTLHESDASSHNENDTLIENVENLIKAKTYDDQRDWYGVCFCNNN